MTNRRSLKKRTRQPARRYKMGKKSTTVAFEHRTYNVIKDLLPRGATVEFEPEQLEYTISYVYKPDFVITFKDGRKLYIETKGNGRSFSDQVRRKMRAIKEQHPDKDVRFLFYADGKVGKSRQSDWAKKHKYDFAIYDLPKEWILENE